MHFVLFFVLLIFLVEGNYANIEEKVAPCTSTCTFPLASPRPGNSTAILFGSLPDLECIEQPSFQGRALLAEDCERDVVY